MINFTIEWDDRNVSENVDDKMIENVGYECVQKSADNFQFLRNVVNTSLDNFWYLAQFM